MSCRFCNIVLGGNKIQDDYALLWEQVDWLLSFEGTYTWISAISISPHSNFIKLEKETVFVNHNYVYLSQTAAVKTSGTTKKLYTMCLKTIESLLDLQQTQSVRDMAVQFGCTGAITLAQQILKR